MVAREGYWVGFWKVIRKDWDLVRAKSSFMVYLLKGKKEFILGG